MNSDDIQSLSSQSERVKSAIHRLLNTIIVYEMLRKLFSNRYQIWILNSNNLLLALMSPVCFVTHPSFQVTSFSSPGGCGCVFVLEALRPPTTRVGTSAGLSTTACSSRVLWLCCCECVSWFIQRCIILTSSR